MPWPQRVRHGIDSLLTGRMFETSQVGLMVYDLTADSVLYSHGERQLLRPASTMKVVTAVAALDRLGADHRFNTSLSHAGDISGRTLTGDLWCVGGFDPMFDGSDMQAFVEAVRQLGVDTIRGRIMADKSFKEPDTLGEGWCWDDDNPVLSPLLIAGKDCFVTSLADRLRDAGVVVEASLGEGRAPAEARTLCTRYHTVDAVLLRMMKDSENLFAEAMFYQIAADVKRPARAASARSAIRRLIDRLGLDAGAYRIADGSGLSLYNYVSAELEVALLRYAYRHDAIYRHLLPSLAVAGGDGTLRKRMCGTTADCNVRAKTGTLTGISSLAGYCTAANGHTLCFAIINQGVMRGSVGRAFQDKVCLLLTSPVATSDAVDGE